MSYISIKSIIKNYGKNRVLDNIDINIDKGEFVSLLGPSGCGKTTLLRIICGLEKLNTGSILVEGKEIINLSPSKRELGIVFQNYVLFPNLTVFENIAYGLINRKEKKIIIKQKVTEILKKVDLLHVKDKYPKQLSGGQQQRIALARAVVLEPKILLLDEPLSALDAKVRESLRKEIKSLQEELNITTIMVTHDQEEALTMSDKIVVMNKAKVMQIGTPEEIYNNPKNDFVANFIGTVNLIKIGNKEINVRPEEFIISKEKKEGFEEIRVKGIEFRGAVYRLNCINNLKSEITVDVPASEKEKLDLKLNNLLYIKVNKI